MGFVVDPSLSIRDVLKRRPDGEAIVILDIDRAPTAAESVNKFMRSLHIASTPGNVVKDRPTPVAGAVVTMANVGVVLRDAEGRRVGEGRNPTLYALVDQPDHIYAAIGNDIVAVTTVLAVPA